MVQLHVYQNVAPILCISKPNENLTKTNQTEEVLSSSEGVEVEEENEAYSTSGVEEETNVIDEEELVHRFLENQ